MTGLGQDPWFISHLHEGPEKDLSWFSIHLFPSETKKTVILKIYEDLKRLKIYTKRLCIA